MTSPSRSLDHSLAAQPETEDLQNALQILRGELEQGTREHFLTDAYQAMSAAEVLVTKALAKMLARRAPLRSLADPYGDGAMRLAPVDPNHVRHEGTYPRLAQETE